MRRSDWLPRAGFCPALRGAFRGYTTMGVASCCAAPAVSDGQSYRGSLRRVARGAMQSHQLAIWFCLGVCARRASRVRPFHFFRIVKCVPFRRTRRDRISFAPCQPCSIVPVAASHRSHSADGLFRTWIPGTTIVLSEIHVNADWCRHLLRRPSGPKSTPQTLWRDCSANRAPTGIHASGAQSSSARTFRLPNNLPKQRQ